MKNEWAIHYESIRFNCGCREPHQYLAIVCKDCQYNLFGFPRNYFDSCACKCVNIERNEACKDCKFLAHSSNSTFKRICAMEEPDFENLIDLNKNLFEKIPGDRIFCFDENKNKIEYRLDSVDPSDFFR